MAKDTSSCLCRVLPTYVGGGTCARADDDQLHTCTSHDAPHGEHTHTHTPPRACVCLIPVAQGPRARQVGRSIISTRQGMVNMRIGFGHTRARCCGADVGLCAFALCRGRCDGDARGFPATQRHATLFFCFCQMRYHFPSRPAPPVARLENTSSMCACT